MFFSLWIKLPYFIDLVKQTKRLLLTQIFQPIYFQFRCHEDHGR